MVFGWLWSWWRRVPLDHLRVVLFTRRGCRLCDVAWQHLRAAQRRYRFALESQDVDSEPAWVREYGEQVPVVVISGRVRFRGRVNPVLLARLLRAEAAARRGAD